MQSRSAKQRDWAEDLDGPHLVALMLMPFVLLTAATLAARMERARFVDASLQIQVAPSVAAAVPPPVLTQPPQPVREPPRSEPHVYAELPPAVRFEMHALLPNVPPSLTRTEIPAQQVSEPRACEQAPHPEPMPYEVARSLSPEAFGMRLTRAARQQLDDFVIYSDRYVSISYPMGDVLPAQGACTDVVIRAYRQLGIDLQELVHRARLGTGDRSIDHRRTETLRRLFARFGDSLPPSSRGDDFKPGDLVTYYRRHNPAPRSRSHIAIVSDLRGPSGNLMIIHNRGSGPEIEDVLFLDRMTGHYRFRGADISKIAEKTGRHHSGSRRGS